MLADMRRLVPSYEDSRKRLLYHKTIFSRRIIEYCDELGIDELMIPDLDFEEPYFKYETVEEEINHLRERVRKFQRVVFELQMAVAEKRAKQNKLKRRKRDIALKRRSPSKVLVERNERPKKLKIVNCNRFPRQSMSEAKRIVISKLRTQYERRVKEKKDVLELSQLLRVERKALATSEPDAERENSPEVLEPDEIPTSQKAQSPILTIEEINAFLTQMCRPIPEPLSPIKSPEREGEFFFSPDLKATGGPVSRQLAFEDSPDTDLNSDLINSAILTSLSV